MIRHIVAKTVGDVKPFSATETSTCPTPVLRRARVVGIYSAKGRAKAASASGDGDTRLCWPRSHVHRKKSDSPPGILPGLTGYPGISYNLPPAKNPSLHPDNAPSSPLFDIPVITLVEVTGAPWDFEFLAILNGSRQAVQFHDLI